MNTICGYTDIVTGVSACNGHIGKFSSCVTEALYVLSLDGCSDSGQTGDVEYDGHFILFVFDAAIPVVIDPDSTDSRTVVIPAGNYILGEDNSGFVDVNVFDSPEAARTDFDGCADRYGQWIDGEPA